MGTSRQGTRHQSDDQQEEQRHDIGGIGDGEMVERLQEEVVIGEDGERAGPKRCRQAMPNGRRQHRNDEHQRHVGDVEPMDDDQAAGRRECGHDQGLAIRQEPAHQPQDGSRVHRVCSRRQNRMIRSTAATSWVNLEPCWKAGLSIA